MVGEAATKVVEISMALVKGGEHVVECGDFGAGDGFEFFQPGIKCWWVGDGESLIRSVGRVEAGA